MADERITGDPDRVVLLLPGGGYSAARPLLHFARAVFLRHGWTTQEVSWSQPPPRRSEPLEPWFAQLRAQVETEVGRLLDAETATRVALAGKSMGAFAAGLAADRGLPAIWLTPVLRWPELAADLRRSTAPYLLIGGSADPSWDSAVAHGLGAPVYEAQGADHGMETDADPAHSAEILKQVTIAMDAFVSRLWPGAPGSASPARG